MTALRPSPGWWVLLAALTTLLCAASALANDAGGTGTPSGQVAAPSDPPVCDPDTGQGCSCGDEVADPIEPINGEWYLDKLDLEVPGVFPIRLMRRYEGNSEYQSPLGAGWAYTYDLRLFEQPEGDVLIRSTCGVLHRYVEDTGNAYALDGPTRGWQRTLRDDPAVSGGYILRDLDGTQRFFDPEGRLERIRDPQGNVLRFMYGAARQPLTGTSRYGVDPDEPLIVSRYFPLEKIREELPEQPTGDLQPTGRHVVFDYDPVNGRLRWAESHDGRRVTYTHDTVGTLTKGNLLSVEHTNGIIETFTYDTTSKRRPHAVLTYQSGQGRTAAVNTYPPELPDPPQTPEEAESERRIQSQTIGARSYDFDYAPSAGDFLAAADHTLADDSQVECNAGVRCTVIERRVVDDAGGNERFAHLSFKFTPEGYGREIIDALGNLKIIRYESGRPYVEEIEIRHDHDGNPATARITERLTVFTHDDDGQMTSRTVTLDTGEVIEESWEYDHGWVSQYKQTSDETGDGTIEETFQTDYTFYREDADGDGIDPDDPVTNIETIERRVGLDGSQQPITEVTELFYNDHGRIAAIELPDGHRVEWSYYDAGDDGGGVIRNGLVEQIAHQTTGGADDDHLRVQYDYDAQGRVSRVTELQDPDTGAANHEVETTYVWDDAGRLLEVENDLGERTILIYGGPSAPDGSGGFLDPTDPGEFLVQVEREGTAESRITRMRYDADGDLRVVERLASTTPSATTYATLFTATYDSDGNRLTTTDGESRTVTRTYDLLNRLTSIQDQVNPATTFTYDATGDRTQVIDARQRVTDFQYDALGRLTDVIQQGGPGGMNELPPLVPPLTTHFDYDAAGNVTLVRDPKSQETVYAYDGVSRLTSVTRELNPAVGYDYDLRGRLERVVNARGQVLDYLYEEWGGLSAVEHYPDETAADDPGTSPTRTVSYTYDLAGNVLSTTDSELDTGVAADGSLHPADRLYSFAYDALHRVDTVEAYYVPGAEQPGGAIVLDSDYNTFGDRDTLTLTEGTGTPLVHDWGFDLRGRLDSAALPGSQALALVRDEVDALETLTHGNGLVSTYGYKPHGPLDSITVAGAAELYKLAYDLDDTDAVTQITESLNGSALTPDYAFAYDGAARLAEATSYPDPAGYGLPVGSAGSPAETFPYDAAGNRDDDPGDPSPWAYNANNEIGASPDTTYAFDDDGNLETRTTPSGTETFTFDQTSRLERYQNGATAADYTYAYDPFGRRLRKTNEVTSDTTWYLWDGDQLLAEYQETSSTSADREVRYAYAGGFAPVQVAYGPAGSETIYDVHTDHLDTPRLLTDSSDPQVPVWRAGYEAFGRAYVSTDPDRNPATADPGIDFNIRFPGQYFDAETGLHYNRFRYYDPSIGRYISADPLGRFGLLGVPPFVSRAGESHSYSYALNDPINLRDLLGLQACGGQAPPMSLDDPIIDRHVPPEPEEPEEEEGDDDGDEPPDCTEAGGRKCREDCKESPFKIRRPRGNMPRGTPRGGGPLVTTSECVIECFEKCL